MNKKISILAMVVAVTISGAIYGISETNAPIMRVSHAQFADFTFEESVEKHALVVVGTISNVQTEILPDNIMGTDENGEKYVYEKHEKPHTKVTLEINEVLKDDQSIDYDTTISFYDRHVNGEIGLSDGQKVRYVSEYATDYNVGDKGIFLIENDREIYSMGFTSFYPIVSDKTTTNSALRELGDKEPIDIETAKNTAKMIAEKIQ